MLCCSPDIIVRTIELKTLAFPIAKHRWDTQLPFILARLIADVISALTRSKDIHAQYAARLSLGKLIIS